MNKVDHNDVATNKVTNVSKNSSNSINTIVINLTITVDKPTPHHHHH
ncbi:hypothetical protein GXW82_21985 [Streptacidiphilus sp. 4-A2]|nr:hypothetical protein [Streptacidiphilus sp. 4-A2]